MSTLPEEAKMTQEEMWAVAAIGQAMDRPLADAAAAKAYDAACKERDAEIVRLRTLIGRLAEDDPGHVCEEPNCEWTEAAAIAREIAEAQVRNVKGA